MIPDIKFMVESKRFVEALYFGALRLASDPSAELHLHLGLACCGTIRPVAEVQRFMNKAESGEESSVSVDGLTVNRGTLLVYEGLFHLVEAGRKNPEIMFSKSMRDVVQEVVNDLGDYLTQEFHGYQSRHRKYSLRAVAAAAPVLLARLIDEQIELPESVNSRIDSANELLKELEASQSGDASFYDLLK
jgi:hypothetical protein